MAAEHDDGRGWSALPSPTPSAASCGSRFARPWVWFVHDDRWRQVATFRGSDTNPKERFVHHNAGLDGFGGSSYIDSVILTDRDQRTGTGGAGGTSDLPWGSAADGTCETRTYLLQNWRADTSVLMKATSGGGVVLQRIKYSPYGTPERLFGIQDFNKDGFVEFTDFDDFVAAFDNGEPSSDVNQDGFLDFSDFDAFQGAFEDTSITDGGREIRKLWAGYEAETTDGARGLYHVRHRVFGSNLGAWAQRDPIGYVFPSASLVEYVHSQATMLIDPTGLQPHISPDGDSVPATHIPNPLPPSLPAPTLKPPTFTGPGWTPADINRVTASYNRVYQRIITLTQNYEAMLASLSSCVQQRVAADSYVRQMIDRLKEMKSLLETKGTEFQMGVLPLVDGDIPDAITDNECQTLGKFGATTTLNIDPARDWHRLSDSDLDKILFHETAHRPEGWNGANRDHYPGRGDNPHNMDVLMRNDIESHLANRVRDAQRQCGESPSYKPPSRPNK